MLTRTSSGPGSGTGISLYTTFPPFFSNTIAFCVLGMSTFIETILAVVEVAMGDFYEDGGVGEEEWDW